MLRIKIQTAGRNLRIYTTNAIESLNYSLRKIIKNRSLFPNDEAVFSVPLAGWRIHEIPDCASLTKTYDISVRVFSDHLPVQGSIKNLPDLQKTDNLFVSY